MMPLTKYNVNEKAKKEGEASRGDRKAVDETKRPITFRGPKLEKGNRITAEGGRRVL